MGQSFGLFIIFLFFLSFIFFLGGGIVALRCCVSSCCTTVNHIHTHERVSESHSVLPDSL